MPRAFMGDNKMTTLTKEQRRETLIETLARNGYVLEAKVLSAVLNNDGVPFVERRINDYFFLSVDVNSEKGWINFTYIPHREYNKLRFKQVRFCTYDNPHLFIDKLAGAYANIETQVKLLPLYDKIAEVLKTGEVEVDDVCILDKQHALNELKEAAEYFSEDEALRDTIKIVERAPNDTLYVEADGIYEPFDSIADIYHEAFVERSY
ncbi:hypothetical protein D6827_02350 [Candidatus Parcubacteria bacterium]|nr:MAG: hypothetical protein D6827_02350 [Candidatus Parcubacteria bacterium]